MAIHIAGSPYSGEALDFFLTRAVTTNQLVEGGHIQVHQNINTYKDLPRVQLDEIIQDRIPTPKSPDDSKGNFKFDYRRLEVQDYMVYVEFNPNDLEDLWRPFQPEGELVFRDLPPHIQTQMIDLVMQKVDLYHAKALWTGDQSTGVKPFDKFDGILTIAQRDPGTIMAPNPVVLTEGNIVDKLKLVYKLVPLEVRDMVKFFISPLSMDLYEDFLTNQPNKGIQVTDAAPKRFKSKQMVPLVGFPDNCIYATIGRPTNSNIHMGCSLLQDANVVQVEKLQNNSEIYFFKMRLKTGTQIGWTEESALYWV